MPTLLVPFGGSAVPEDKPDKQVVGGKGLGLTVMSKIGITVPPGFTLTTHVCKLYEATGEMPDELWEEVKLAVKRVEIDMGKTFGDREAPLLFSCRSGAAISMPGMVAIYKPVTCRSFPWFLSQFVLHFIFFLSTGMMDTVLDIVSIRYAQFVNMTDLFVAEKKKKHHCY